MKLHIKNVLYYINWNSYRVVSNSLRIVSYITQIVYILVSHRTGNELKTPNLIVRKLKKKETLISNLHIAFKLINRMLVIIVAKNKKSIGFNANNVICICSFEYIFVALNTYYVAYMTNFMHFA